MSLFNDDPRERVNKELVDSAFRDIKEKLAYTFGAGDDLHLILLDAINRYMLNKAEQKIIMDHFIGGDQMKREPIKIAKIKPDIDMIGKKVEIHNDLYELKAKYSPQPTRQYLHAVIVGFTDYSVVVKTLFDGKLHEVKEEWLKYI